MTKKPHYIGLEEAREVLAEMGVEVTPRQIKRAADVNPAGKRRLPFFVDPIEGRLKIEKETLRRIYIQRQVEAENKFTP